MRHHHFGDGRYVLRLDPGEDLLGQIQTFAAEQGITAGHITGLGSVDRITLGFLDPEEKEYLKRVFEEPMEVAQFTATISTDGDKPMIHAHAVVAPRELLAYAGHVHTARVGVVMELIVTSFPATLRRLPVTGQPFLGLFLPGEAPPEEDAAPR